MKFGEKHSALPVPACSIQFIKLMKKNQPVICVCAKEAMNGSKTSFNAPILPISKGTIKKMRT
jgi:hypothetical protein